MCGIRAVHSKETNSLIVRQDAPEEQADDSAAVAHEGRAEHFNKDDGDKRQEPEADIVGVPCESPQEAK